MRHVIKGVIGSDQISEVEDFVYRAYQEAGEPHVALRRVEEDFIIPGADRADSWHDVSIEFIALGSAGLSSLAMILKNYWQSKRKQIRLIDSKTGRIVEYDGTDSHLAEKLLRLSLKPKDDE